MVANGSAETVMAWIEAHNDKDVERMLRNVSGTVTVRSASGGEAPVTGSESAGAFWARMFDTFPDHRFEVVDLTVEGGTVFAEVDESGTMEGPLGPNPPTGKHFGVRAAFRFDVRDGKIDSIVSYWDMAAVGRQLELA